MKAAVVVFPGINRERDMARTLATPFKPSERSAPSMALPCGSRMPDFRVTVTRAFMFCRLCHESPDNLGRSPGFHA